MTLYSGGSIERPTIPLDDISRQVLAFASDGPESWEIGYLGYHRRRFQDTLTLLGEGGGRRLLDVGAFPGHLSALARARGWEVEGLNSTIEAGGSYEQFLRRCAARQIVIHSCEVERDRFPVASASFDAVLFSELFEHLCFNPFHTLREIFRVLRPGGVLVLTTPNLRRIETFARLLHGWGYQPPLSRTFRELLPSLLHHRHNREYTGNELRYYLALQGKDLYDFGIERLCYSDCLDGAPQIPGILGQRPGRIESTISRRLQQRDPSLRGQIMIRAVRSGATFLPWEGLGGLEGLGDSREDALPHQGFTRRVTFPLRPTGPRVRFEVPIPAGEGPALVSFMAAHLGEGAPTLRTRWRVNDRPIMEFEFRPSHRAVRVRLLVPAQIAAAGRARIELETAVWEDPIAGGPAGPHLGGPGILVERLPTPAAIAAVFERMRAEERAEEGQIPVVAAAQSMGLPRFPSTLAIGPADSSQLGEGWFPLENRGLRQWFRWTGPEAVAFLSADGLASTARVRLRPGDPRLGQASGEVIVEQARSGDFLSERARVPFTLTEDRWTEISAPLAKEAGTVRITIRVVAARTPQGRVPGSEDTRPLGVAVRKIWLA